MSLILLIDDDADMLALTSRWLTKAGYEVAEASSGSIALETLKSTKPDLIVLDYAMPEMDGPAVLAAIKSDETIKNIPVLYRTGMEDGNIETGGEGQASGIVPKSEGKPALLKAVADQLA